MVRLIDADALQDEYVRLSGRELKLIDEAPTIDAVPVVRCKDCLSSWVMPKEMRNVGEYRCEFWYAEMHGDDYCSYGERREHE